MACFAVEVASSPFPLVPAAVPIVFPVAVTAVVVASASTVVSSPLLLLVIVVAAVVVVELPLLLLVPSAVVPVPTPSGQYSIVYPGSPSAEQVKSTVGEPSRES